MKILNFSSTILKNGPALQGVAEIIACSEQSERNVVVFPALNGVEDYLIRATKLAAAAEDYPEQLQSVKDLHLGLVQELIPAREQAGIITPLQIMINDLEDVLKGVQLLREYTRRTLDLVLSFGVQMSCSLVAGYLQVCGLPAVILDARRIIRTNDYHGNGVVSREVTSKLISACLKKENNGLPVIGGGLASAESGATTSLGKNGADYTASLLAEALNAGSIEIWTDEDGVMSADPAYVKEAFIIPELNYQEAMELAYFGAKILHPRTMIPAVEGDIPIQICNVNKPGERGTLISSRAADWPYDIRGIASFSGAALVNIEGGGMIGIPGIAARVFSALAGAEVNIMMISQASSEHSICLVFSQDEADRALNALTGELEPELNNGSIRKFEMLKDLVVGAVIGENMRGTPGISGKVFSSLGRAGVNVLAIAQGSSERNISFVIGKQDQAAALKTIHNTFLTGEV